MLAGRGQDIMKCLCAVFTGMAYSNVRVGGMNKEGCRGRPCGMVYGGVVCKVILLGCPWWRVVLCR